MNLREQNCVCLGVTKCLVTVPFSLEMTASYTVFSKDLPRLCNSRIKAFLSTDTIVFNTLRSSSTPYNTPGIMFSVQIQDTRRYSKVRNHQTDSCPQCFESADLPLRNLRDFLDPDKPVARTCKSNCGKVDKNALVCNNDLFVVARRH